MTWIRCFGFAIYALAVAVPATGFGDDLLHAGPLFDEFDLTLTPGHRSEAAGPFFYKQQRDTERVWGFPPLGSLTRDPGTESVEFDFVYPVLTYDRYGDQYRIPRIPFPGLA